MFLPVLTDAYAESPLLWRAGRPIERREFTEHSRRIASRLGNTRYAINLCQDRYFFLLGFVAGCLRGQTQLLPANQTSGALQSLALAYPDHCTLNDDDIAGMLEGPSAEVRNEFADLACSGDHIAAIAFTSGSTGEPQAHPCSWTMLSNAAERTSRGIFSPHSGHRAVNIVATVPPQHMFGLEITVLQPLLGGNSVVSSKPFFPADVAAAMREVPTPRALISTPTHLRTLAASGVQLPEIAFTLSATAPMPLELAATLETQWQAPVLEIYGSTETGAIATRRTISESTWTVLPGGHLRVHDGKAQFGATGLACGITLHDQLELLDERRFKLAGRSSDLIKVAGKRVSLAELNTRLLAIPGVSDGVVIQPTPDGRTAALVIASIGEPQILAGLAQHVDEVFLPRPLRIVESLPRDSMGKLPRKQVLAALGISAIDDE